MNDRTPERRYLVTERQWELYRLSVVEEWPESPRKAAVIRAIRHKLMIMAQEQSATTIGVPDIFTAEPHKVTL